MEQKTCFITGKTIPLKVRKQVDLCELRKEEVLEKLESVLSRVTDLKEVRGVQKHLREVERQIWGLQQSELLRESNYKMARKDFGLGQEDRDEAVEKYYQECKERNHKELVSCKKKQAEARAKILNIDYAIEEEFKGFFITNSTFEEMFFEKMNDQNKKLLLNNLLRFLFDAKSIVWKCEDCKVSHFVEKEASLKKKEQAIREANILLCSEEINE